MTSERLLFPADVQAIAVGVLLLFLVWVLQLIRQQRLNLRDSLLWLLSTITALCLMAFPQSLLTIAHALHVQVPSNALFAGAFVYVLLNLLSLTISLAQNAVRTRRLTQECALLRGEVELLRARVTSAESDRGLR
jgi:hypothetical protein